MPDIKQRLIEELDSEIFAIKAYLNKYADVVSKSERQEGIERLGELIIKKNELTGQTEDILYFFLNDNEWYRELGGFIGENADVCDINGIPLKIGDTVILQGKGDQTFARIIFKDMPTQEALNQKRAIKIKDYTELDLKDSNNVAFTVSLCSCREVYEKSIQQEQEFSM